MKKLYMFFALLVALSFLPSIAEGRNDNQLFTYKKLRCDMSAEYDPSLIDYDKEDEQVFESSTLNSCYINDINRGNYLGYKQVINCESWVSLWEFPSVTDKRICKVPLGATVEVFDCSLANPFYECYYNGMHGYISPKYLSYGGGYITPYRTGFHIGQTRIVNCDEYAEIYRIYDTKSEIVAKAAKGDLVDTYYYNSMFCECNYNGVKGYILTQYLGYVPCNETSSEPMGTMVVANCKKWVTLREYASTRAPTIALVRLGETVEVKGYNSEYAKCEYHGVIGYIQKKYLSPLSTY